MPNEMHEKYYSKQLQLPAEELHDIISAFRKPLPLSVRLADKWFPISSKAVLDELSQEISRLEKQLGRKQQTLTGIKWYDKAWQINDLRKQDIVTVPSMKNLSSFLNRNATWGRHIRQELVSMLPVLLLNKGRHGAFCVL